MAQLDQDKLNAFVGKMLGDLGGAFSVPTVRIGLRLGLFDALHNGGPATSDELAKRAGGLTERLSASALLKRRAAISITTQPRGNSVCRQSRPWSLLKRTVRFISLER